MSRPCRAWTTGDERHLKAWWGRETAQQLADELGRTRKAVVHRAKLCGLPYPGPSMAVHFYTEDERESHGRHMAQIYSEKRTQKAGRYARQDTVNA